MLTVSKTEESHNRSVYFPTDDEITVGNFRTPMLFRFYLPSFSWSWFTQYPEVRGASHVESVVSYISGQKYKLSRYFDPDNIAPDEWELYNLTRDPYELNNSLESESLFKTLRFRLEELRKKHVDRYLP